jgi:DNA-binding IscR family transcriptional regulator
MAKKKIKEEDVLDNIIEDVGKKADIIFKKSTEKKSSPHMSVDQIADRADKEVDAYLKKVMLGTTHKDYSNKYKKKLQYK